MKNINQHIEDKTIKQFYLIYGEEDYLKSQYKDKLVKALLNPEDTMNYSRYEGAGVNVLEVLEIANTLPFFSDSRVIVLENSKWFEKYPKDLDLEMLEALPDSTYIIFVESDVDKRGRLYKWIDKHGYASAMNAPDGKMLQTWIAGLCKAEGKQIEKEAVDYFLEHVGMDKTNMLLMKNELEKVFAYCSDKTAITTKDIKDICVSQATDKMFEMLDAIGSCERERALLLYHDFLALREPAMRVHVMLTRHFRILMKVKGLSESGMDNKTIASICGIPPFSVKKYAAQTGKYSYERLKDMVEQCQEIDYKIKTGQIKDTVGVELLIVEFSGK